MYGEVRCCAILCAVLFGVIMVPVFPLRVSQVCSIPFDKEVFPWDYDEPWKIQNPNMTTEYEQLYSGVDFSDMFCECVLMQYIVLDQKVVYGVVCEMAGIKNAANEWAIAGFVKYSDGERYLYIKYSTLKDGFDQLSFPIPEYMGWGWHSSVMFTEGIDNQWHASVDSVPNVYEANINFTYRPTSFYFYLKSLWHENIAQMNVTCIAKKSSDKTEFLTNANVREDQPYVVTIKIPYYKFFVNGGVPVPEPYGGGRNRLCARMTT